MVQIFAHNSYISFQGEAVYLPIKWEFQTWMKKIYISIWLHSRYFHSSSILIRLAQAPWTSGCYGNSACSSLVCTFGSDYCHFTDLQSEWICSGLMKICACISAGATHLLFCFFMSHCTSTITVLASARVLREHFSRSLLIDELLSREPFPLLSAIWKEETRTRLEMKKEDESSNKSVWCKCMSITKSVQKQSRWAHCCISTHLSTAGKEIHLRSCSTTNQQFYLLLLKAITGF